MLQIICGIIGMVLLLLGCIEIVRVVSLMIFKTKDDDKIMVVVPVSGHNEEVEYLLRSALAKLRWIGSVYERVVCIDCGMDDETRKICDIIKKDYPFIEVYTQEEFKEIFYCQRSL